MILSKTLAFVPTQRSWHAGTYFGRRSLGGVEDEEIDDISGGFEGFGTKKTSDAEVDPTRSVRSALVQMGWGTMRDTGDADAYDLRVVAGARLDAAAGGGAGGQIVPLGKASNARVNKILEGSMEGGM